MKNSIQFGIPEMDSRVLHFLDAKTLLSICTLNSYTPTLLTEEFWMDAFKRLYPTFPVSTVDFPLDLLHLFSAQKIWEITEWAINDQNIEVLTWMEQNQYMCPVTSMMAHVLDCKHGNEFSKVLKWLVEEHNIVPDEGDLLTTFDDSWLKYCPDPLMIMNCDIKKWLLETYDIKMNEYDDF